MENGRLPTTISQTKPARPRAPVSRRRARGAIGSKEAVRGRKGRRGLTIPAPRKTRLWWWWLWPVRRRRRATRPNRSRRSPSGCGVRDGDLGRLHPIPDSVLLRVVRKDRATFACSGYVADNTRICGDGRLSRRSAGGRTALIEQFLSDSVDSGTITAADADALLPAYIFGWPEEGVTAEI